MGTTVPTGRLGSPIGEKSGDSTQVVGLRYIRPPLYKELQIYAFDLSLSLFFPVHED